MSRKTTLLLWSVAVLVLAALIGSYLLLPAVLERWVAGGLQEQLGSKGTPEVELWAEPPPAMPGRFSGGSITAREAQLGGVRSSVTVVDLGPFALDLLGSIAAGAPRSEEAPSGTMRVELSEKEVAGLVRQETDLPVRGVSFEEGSVTVNSEAEGLGIEVPLSVRGDLTFQNGALLFEPRQLSAAGVPVEEELSDLLFAEASFEYTPERLPYGAEITGVEVREERLVLNAEAERVSFEG